MFNPVMSDTLSPSSVGGLLAMYTTNGTWFGMGFTQIFFKEDDWRILGAGGVGSKNFQFYIENPVDSWIPYNTRADFVYAEVQRRLINKLYLGVSYIFMNLNTASEFLPITEKTTLNGMGLKLSMDKRSNVYYPRNGYFTNAQWFTYPKAFGNEVESNKIEVDYNHYFPFRHEQDVLAARLFAGIGLGDLSFNQQFIVGKKDIRGYSQGEFRGNHQLAVQAEYRWNFWKRWGVVGFAGLATIFDSINESDNGKLLPGIGTGFRFTAFTDNHMNVGMDIAAGRNDWGIYFRIGEVF
jgi:outer membrane protein assembly factor BamA